ncbi:hypothetical protein D9611_003721 [Ephemerocybe angulata]|uniref:Uncharacterized protein n=1 Tax=Ephemerocybe angulata TaxID=980116 RepID=A0A8H5EYV9_9AGAR|nr:hypothetical protein D9611_003721 [Tulosesus angulatus]
MDEFWPVDLTRGAASSLSEWFGPPKLFSGSSMEEQREAAASLSEWLDSPKLFSGSSMGEQREADSDLEDEELEEEEEEEEWFDALEDFESTVSDPLSRAQNILIRLGDEPEWDGLLVPASLFADSAFFTDELVYTSFDTQSQTAVVEIEQGAMVSISDIQAFIAYLHGWRPHQPWLMSVHSFYDGVAKLAKLWNFDVEECNVEAPSPVISYVEPEEELSESDGDLDPTLVEGLKGLGRYLERYLKQCDETEGSSERDYTQDDAILDPMDSHVARGSGMYLEDMSDYEDEEQEDGFSSDDSGESSGPESEVRRVHVIFEAEAMQASVPAELFARPEAAYFWETCIGWHVCHCIDGECTGDPAVSIFPEDGVSRNDLEMFVRYLEGWRPTDLRDVYKLYSSVHKFARLWKFEDAERFAVEMVPCLAFAPVTDTS